MVDKTRTELEKNILSWERKIEFDIEDYAWLNSEAMDGFVDAWQELADELGWLPDRDIGIMVLDSYFKWLQCLQDVLDYDFDPSSGLVFTEYHRNSAKSQRGRLTGIMQSIRETGWDKYNNAPDSE
jgi:hypothetical protein